MNAELLAFLDAQAARLTHGDIVSLADRLPTLRERFHGIAGLESPDLAEQLEFLSEIVEDCATGVNCEVPDACRREAAFARLYLERESHILPDKTPGIGLVDVLVILRQVISVHFRRAVPGWVDASKRVGGGGGSAGGVPG